MKIVIATTTAFHLRHCAAQLIERGNEVTFMSYLPHWKTASYNLPREATRSFFWQMQPTAALALWRGGGRILAPLRERLLESTDKAIAANVPPCDVFIGLSSMAVASAMAARRQYGAKIVIDRGSSHVVTQARLVAQGGGKGLTDNYIERELASYDVADYVVVPSRFAAKSFIDEGFSPDRLHVAMLGADTSRFRPNRTPAALPVRTLFVGQWSDRKGVDLIAEALKRMPALDVTHVGVQVDAPFPKSPRFKSVGYLNHARLSVLMPQYHILVLPSRNDGFGMVMTEALASGLRVVASDATGGPDLAAIMGKQHVEVFPSGSIEAFVASLERLTRAIENDLAGFRPVDAEIENLSWRKYGDLYNQFLHNLGSGLVN